MKGYTVALLGAICTFLMMQSEVLGNLGIDINEIEAEIMDVVYANCDTMIKYEPPANPNDTIYLRMDEFSIFGIRSYPMYPDAAKSVIESSQFDPNRPTVIYIHGFTDNPTDVFGLSFGIAYTIHGGYNILALDSSKLIGILYYRSSVLAKYIGESLAGFVHNLIKYGVKVQDIHLIGHSLGAHIAGFTGKAFIKISGGIKLPRITGLDPSGPCFTHNAPEERLDKGDADFVDIIHTNKGSMGFLGPPIGHVEFFPNGGGVIQPGCLESICSHMRSLFLYEESVNHNENFIGALCDSEEDFNNGHCINNERAVMGYATPNTTRGTFYLWTAGIPLYGEGAAGAYPPNKKLK